MSVACVATRAQLGLTAPPVSVEVHLGAGLPVFSIVGMAATAVRESKERVRAALVNSGFEFPAGRITVNLSPADLPKEGCRYDLPIALGILLASEQIKARRDAARFECFGELGLDGEVRAVRGLLLAAAAASQASERVIAPHANRVEVAIVARERMHTVRTLVEACNLLVLGSKEATSESAGAEALLSAQGPAAAAHALDLADVRGQALAKRALVVAAAGEHSVLLVGPPGTGKSMLAQRLPALLPPLSEDQAIEVAGIASVSAQGFDPRAWRARPYRAPHHTASAHAIIGGGPRAAPGEISLAHRGVLFLDELPEFDRRVLESLREPLESRRVAIARASFRAEYPAAFQLIAAMNPCPCGFRGDSSGKCRCTPPEIARYRSRISGPLLDRIDLRVEVGRVSSEELLDDGAESCAPGNGPANICTSAAVALVSAARARQLERGGKLNAHLTSREIAAHCSLDRPSKQLVAQARLKLGLSARATHRVLRVARTIADLEGTVALAPNHLAEALQLRRAVQE
jgi:magnesium chelatase family protein